MNDKIVEKTEEKDNIQLNSSEEDKKRLDSLWEGNNEFYFMETIFTLKSL